MKILFHLTINLSLPFFQNVTTVCDHAWIFSLKYYVKYNSSSNNMSNFRFSNNSSWKPQTLVFTLVLVFKEQQASDRTRWISNKILELISNAYTFYSYFAWFGPLVTFVLPPLIPYYFWNESFLISFFVVGILRQTLWLHGVFFINSAAHMWGTKPYDK